MDYHTASDVAKWFLQRNEREIKLRDAEYITHLKLQKLLYYAQGVFAGFYNDRLFSEDIKAWAHGPVVEEVYYEYKTHGSRGIEVFTAPIESYSKDEENVLDMVYDNFGQYSAWALRNMTHSERPWQATPQSEVIPFELIRDFFKEEYVENGEES